GLAVGAKQCQAGPSVRRHIHSDAAALLIGEAQRGSAVGLYDDGGARIAVLVHQAETTLAVGSDADGGLRRGAGVEQHDAGDAVGETDFGARFAVVAVDAESRGARFQSRRRPRFALLPRG